jgi:glutathione peroxidase
MLKTTFLVFLFSFTIHAMEKSFYDFQVTGIDGSSVSLSKYKGKVALVFNSASECGYTKQLKELQEVYTKYKDKGLVVLGFPSNDFGRQEPGSDKDIKKFCETQYAISFPLFSKAHVEGEGKQPVFKFLTEEPSTKGEILWNFEKFLVGKKGELIARYRSGENPMGPTITQAIEAALK